MTDTQATTTTTTGSARRAPHDVEGELLYFRLNEQIAELRADLQSATGSRTAKTLAKSGGLRVLLVVVEGGVTLEPEAAAGASTLQVLEGRLRVTAGGQAQEVGPGELAILSQNLRQPVEAVQPSAFLVTVAWPEGTGADDQEELASNRKGN